jgi:peptide-methionine (S)-S-oxide reductase
MNLFFKKTLLPRQEDALPGRQQTMPVTNRHLVTGNPILPPFPEGLEQTLFGMGCFWGAERKLWQQPGIFTTAVGYAGGFTPNPSYDEVCTGMTGHNEVVLVVFDPAIISFQDLLTLFWESHNPTQGMRQGNDVGSQYRSSIDTYTAEHSQLALESLKHYQSKLQAAGMTEITTELRSASKFYYAEDLHQQYLFKNPQGYCGLKGLGIAYGANQ